MARKAVLLGRVWFGRSILVDMFLYRQTVIILTFSRNYIKYALSSQIVFFEEISNVLD